MAEIMAVKEALLRRLTAALGVHNAQADGLKAGATLLPTDRMLVFFMKPDTYFEEEAISDLADGPKRLYDSIRTAIAENGSFEVLTEDGKRISSAPPKPKEDEKPKPEKKEKKPASDDWGDEPAESEKEPEKDEGKDSDDWGDPSEPAKNEKTTKTEKEETAQEPPKRGRGRPPLSDEEKAARKAGDAPAKAQKAEKPEAPTKPEENADAAAVRQPSGEVQKAFTSFTPARNVVYLSGFVAHKFYDTIVKTGKVPQTAIDEYMFVMGERSTEVATANIVIGVHALRGAKMRQNSPEVEFEYAKAAGHHNPAE